MREVWRGGRRLSWLDRWDLQGRACEGRSRPPSGGGAQGRGVPGGSGQVLGAGPEPEEFGREVGAVGRAMGTGGSVSG